MNRCWVAALMFAFALVARALDGVIQIHDPSTVVRAGGKFYTYGTGGSALVSDDGWSWRRGVALSRRGPAPDVIHLGDRYCVYIAANIGAQPRAEVNMIWNTTLDPASPQYRWQEGGVVASSDGEEDCNAIDPGVFLDPTDGRLWLVYGSYFGYIRLVELDPKTGARINASDEPVNLAINCEASIVIYRDGWYYLLATHGTCCRGADSTYNIRMGRARKITGPFLDHEGIDMIQGGGKLFVGSSSRRIGPGHFGLLDLGGDVQLFSCHYEADLDRGGASVLDLRPLLWRDGWPVAGDHVTEGTYRLESVRTGTVLELAVEGMPVGGPRGRGGPGRGRGGPGAAAASSGPGAAPTAAGSGAIPPAGSGAAPGGIFAGTGASIPPQDVAQVATRWPTGDVALRLGNFMDQAQQKWTITPVPESGGYPGAPYFKITVAGTGRTLAATLDGELVALAAFTGAPEQLWRIEQYTDGTYRIMPKSGADAAEPLALSALGSSFPTLSKLNPAGDKQRWLLRPL